MRNMRMMRIMRICGICGCVCGLKISSTLYTYEYLPKMATFWARNGSAWLCFQFWVPKISLLFIPPGFIHPQEWKLRVQNHKILVKKRWFFFTIDAVYAHWCASDAHRCASAKIGAWPTLVETLIGRMALEHAVSLHGSSLRWWRLKTNLKWRYFYVFVQSTAVFMFPGPTQFEGLFSDRDQTSRYTQCKSLFSVFRIRVTKRFFVQYIFVNLHPPLFSWASISSTYPCQSVRKSVRL